MGSVSACFSPALSSCLLGASEDVSRLNCAPCRQPPRRAEIRLKHKTGPVRVGPVGFGRGLGSEKHMTSTSARQSVKGVTSETADETPETPA